MRPFLALFALAACAPMPPGRATRGLYVDLHRIVEDAELDEWTVDRRQIADLSTTTFRSACQVDPASRLELLAWLDHRIRSEGGPAEAAWRRAGGDLDAVEDLLTLERIRSLLVYVDERAQEECPFWIEVDRSFPGVQSDAHRLVLLLESAGGGQVVVSGGQTAVGAMGGGRILPAWGLSQRLTVALGPEVGADGSFKRTESGERELEAQFLMAIPLLFRFHDSNQFWDAELAATGRFTEGALLALRPGLRAAAGVGLSTLRVGDLMPYAALWVGYEIQPAWHGEPSAHSVRLGTGFGFDWDP